MFQTALFGRTYKNSYSITLNESGPGRTSITVQSNLMMEQFGFYNRERNVDWFEAYLREDLFSRLCTTYYQDPRQCNAVFNNSPQQLNSSFQDSAPAYDQQHFMQVPTSELQQALVDAGYNPGPVDGILGGKTRDALAQFQQDRGLQSSGVVDPPTLRALSL